MVDSGAATVALPSRNADRHCRCGRRRDLRRRARNVGGRWFRFLLLCAHGDGIFLVTPLAGAVLVWLTFGFARQMSGPGAGAAAALIVATTPIVLFQVTQ